MSIKIFTSVTGESAMYDGETEIFFGPLFGEDEDPAEFIEWLEDNRFEADPKQYKESEIVWVVDKWRKEVRENEAEAAGERHFTESGAWIGAQRWQHWCNPALLQNDKTGHKKQS